MCLPCERKVSEDKWQVKMMLRSGMQTNLILELERERERAVYKTISLEIKTHLVLWELMKPPVTKP